MLPGNAQFDKVSQINNYFVSFYLWINKALRLLHVCVNDFRTRSLNMDGSDLDNGWSIWSPHFTNARRFAPKSRDICHVYDQQNYTKIKWCRSFTIFICDLRDKLLCGTKFVCVCVCEIRWRIMWIKNSTEGC